MKLARILCWATGHRWELGNAIFGHKGAVFPHRYQRMYQCTRCHAMKPAPKGPMP